MVGNFHQHKRFCHRWLVSCACYFVNIEMDPQMWCHRQTGQRFPLSYFRCTGSMTRELSVEAVKKEIDFVADVRSRWEFSFVLM